MRIILTGEDALKVQYAIALARFKYPEFTDLTDSEILEALIETGAKKGEQL